jgi:hypothetical protein
VGCPTLRVCAGAIVCHCGLLFESGSGGFAIARGYLITRASLSENQGCKSRTHVLISLCPGPLFSCASKAISFHIVQEPMLRFLNADWIAPYGSESVSLKQVPPMRPRHGSQSTLSGRIPAQGFPNSATRHSYIPGKVLYLWRSLNHVFMGAHILPHCHLEEFSVQHFERGISRTSTYTIYQRTPSSPRAARLASFGLCVSQRSRRMARMSNYD